MKKIILILLLLPVIAHGLERGLEVRYPNVSNIIAPPTHTDANLVDYFKYFYQFLIAASGIIFFGILFMSGVRIVIGASNPEIINKAKQDIYRIGLGALIIFFSYLILNTINPQITHTNPTIETMHGVTVCDEKCEILNKSVSDLQKEAGFKPTSLEFHEDPNVLDVIMYDQKDYKGDGELFSGDEGIVEFSPKSSMKIIWEEPGVYLCTEEYIKDKDLWICLGKEGHLPLSTGLIDEGFRKKMEGVHIKRKNREGEEIEYGVIFHQDRGQRGKAEVFSTMELPKDEYMKFLGDLDGTNPFLSRIPTFNFKDSKSMTVFSPSQKVNGEGVFLCEEPNPDENRKPNCYGPYKDIQGTLKEEFNDESTSVSLEEVPNANSCTGQWFDTQSGISSLIINGDYLVVLFNKEDFQGEAEIFVKSDFNLIDNRMGQCCEGVSDWGRSDCASSVMIIPIKDLQSSVGDIPTSLPTCQNQCEEGDVECVYSEPPAEQGFWSYKVCQDLDPDACLDWPREYTKCPNDNFCDNENPSKPCQAP